MAQLQATTVDGVLNSLRTDNIQTNSYSLLLTDRDRVVVMNNSSEATVTVPNDSTTNFPVGSMVYVSRIGAGAVTLSAGSGVTVSRTGQFASGEEVFLRKRSANNWFVVDQAQTLSGSGGAISTAAGYNIHTFSTVGAATFAVA
jgi:hypothetical protein